MAQLTWKGYDSEDFDTASNWEDQTGAPSGASPATTDSVYFTKRAHRPCRVNMSQSAENYPNLVVDTPYQFDLGTGSQPLVCSADYVMINTDRRVYLAKGSGLFDRVVIENGNVFIKNPNNASGEWTLYGGFLQVVGSGTRVLGTVTMDVNPNSRSMPTAIFDGTVTQLDLRQGHAMMREASTLTTANVDGGTLISNCSTFTTLVQNGGQVFINSTTVPGTVTQNDGLYSFSGNQWGDNAISINTHDWYGGQVDLRTGKGNIDMTGGTFTVRHDAGEGIRFDAGRTISFS